MSVIDIVSDIVLHFDMLAGTRRALAATAAGRHEVARRLYEQILTEMEELEQLDEAQQPQQGSSHGGRFPLLGPAGLPSKYEEGLIFEERLRCLALLGQWQVIPGPGGEGLGPQQHLSGRWCWQLAAVGGSWWQSMADGSSPDDEPQSQVNC